jgi:hypothetical protein
MEIVSWAAAGGERCGLREETLTHGAILSPFFRFL